MTKQIDFYLLNKPTLADCLPFCARLITKVYQAGHRIRVICEQNDALSRLDSLLWDNATHPFLPHTRAESPPGLQIEALDANDEQVILLLTPMAALPATPWQRLLHVVPSSPDCLSAARAQYRTLTADGHTVKTHNIGK